MSDEKKEDSRIITADKMRQERNNGGRHNFCTKEQAAGVAASMGQMVYDQLREQHAMSMQALDEDLEAKLADIRKVIIANITDLQTRSLSYRIRRDFAFDVDQIIAWVRLQVELVRGYLGVVFPSLAPDRKPEAPLPADYPNVFSDDPEHVGAPSELPETFSTPEIAKRLTLSSSDRVDG